MFYLLYYTESMDLKQGYCLITSTNCFINQQRLSPNVCSGDIRVDTGSTLFQSEFL